MDTKEIEAELNSPSRPEADPGVFVCEASFEDWTRYVKSEQHALMSRAMAWNDGKIYIVELPGRMHETFLGFLDVAVLSATLTGDEYLQFCRSTYVDNLEPIEPDSSFGLVPGFGATKPNGLSWFEYHTLKVEVGVSRGWRQLDARAVQWSQFPGVEFILLIRLSPDLEVHQYMLYSVVNGILVPPIMAAISIDNPTNIVLDSRRLLGLPADALIPANFTAPNLTIDLFPLVQRITNLFNA
ncbi:hypothetical protein AeMF1_005361 [Aphanomyces euteiches]|nr:hypothetical protein AeMF1_005361 [Aphanomyces euteiches]KAH9187435.1 hypothetical protein AeNC1_010591 [Aphanomyces euteiches]